MGLNHCISYRSLPFHSTDGHDRPPPIAGNVAQIIREISFALATKSGDPVGWNAIKGSGRKPETLQKLQPVQQAVRVCRVLANLKLAQPDKTADPVIDVFRKQGIQPASHGRVETVGDARFHPTFGGDKRISAEPFDHRHPGQNGLAPAAFCHEPTRQLLIRARNLSLSFKPNLQVAGTTSGKHLVAIDRSKLDQMIPPSLFADGVALQLNRLHSQLSRDEPDRFFWDDLSSRQEAAGVSKRAKLKGKPKPVL